MAEENLEVDHKLHSRIMLITRFAHPIKIKNTVLLKLKMNTLTREIISHCARSMVFEKLSARTYIGESLHVQ